MKVLEFAREMGVLAKRGGVSAVESGGGPTAYVAVEKTGHHRTIADLLAVPEPETPATGPIDRDAMRRRLRTATGRAAYKKRKETVEPVFGIWQPGSANRVIGSKRSLVRFDASEKVTTPHVGLKSKRSAARSASASKVSARKGTG